MRTAYEKLMIFALVLGLAVLLFAPMRSGIEDSLTLTPEHLENHKAYVQSWIQTIRDKPETLVKAIRDAQAAASYMDYKAGLITEKDYEKAKESSMEIKPKEKDLER